ncbi:MAG: topoisomerase C-terminal repeat-containing protein, partial [Pseudomonadota bacterium]
SNDGQPVEANIGRFGPYVKYGKKYVSIKDEDPHTITLDQALELIKVKQAADANRVVQQFAKNDIQVLNGRYGPYITNGKKNARIPKDSDPATLTLEECEQLLAKAPNRKTRRRAAPKKKRRTSN